MALAAPVLAFSAVSVSSTTAYSSVIIPAMNIWKASVQAVTSGSNPTGALKVQFSNDNPASGLSSDVSHWSDLGSATVSTTSNGVYKIDAFDVCAMWIKLVYTNASNSGAITAHVKTLGY